MAAGAGIHVNEAERLVAHDFQDVGVTADEQTGPQPTDFLPRAPVVVAGITADMSHVDGDAFAFPNEIPRQVSAEVRPVDISENSADRFEGS